MGYTLICCLDRIRCISYVLQVCQNNRNSDKMWEILDFPTISLTWGTSHFVRYFWNLLTKHKICCWSTSDHTYMIRLNDQHYKTYEMYLISLYICPNQIELHQIIIFDSNNLSISMPHPPFIQSSVGRRKSSLIQERAKRTLVVTSHSNYPKVGSSGGLYTWVLQGCLIRPLLH